MIFLTTDFTNTSKKEIVDWHGTHYFANLVPSSAFYGDGFLQWGKPLSKAALMSVFHLRGLAEVRTGLKHFSAMLHNCHNAWRQRDGIEAKNDGRYKNSLSNEQQFKFMVSFFECHCQRIGWMLRCATSHTLIICCHRFVIVNNIFLKFFLVLKTKHHSAFG